MITNNYQEILYELFFILSNISCNIFYFFDALKTRFLAKTLTF